MSKTIVRIDQMSDGGINPETDITEDVLWTLHFDNDGGTRILGKIQMLTYLTAGTSPIKNVHSFKKWDIKTRLGHIIRTWVVVYDDKSHVQLTNDSFYALLMNGHRNKEEEKEPEEVADVSDDISQRGAISKAIQQAQEESQVEKKQPITSSDEREEVDSFRDKVREDSKFQEFRDLMREDARPNPDAKGYDDKR